MCKAIIPFACPICQKALREEEKSLVCEAKHRFDLARQGYVNLLLKKPEGFYENKALFVSRRAVYESGFFDAVIHSIAAHIQGSAVLDAGCGEGSLLHAIKKCKEIEGIGLDISKCAVSMASSAYKQIRWCVGDLCKLPLPSESMDCIINMLTPANYGEFLRVLKPGGTLIKLIPNSNHLQEIRALSRDERHDSKLEETTSVFSRHMSMTKACRILDRVNCSKHLAEHVYQMTPMTVHTLLPIIQACAITIDLSMLMGRKALSMP